MKTAGSSDISYTVSATRRPTTRLKPSTSCWRKANAVSPSSVPRANVKTIHWEISACSSTISGADVRTYADYGIFIPCRSTRTFPSHPGQQVSIINFTAHGLHGKGLVYPLSDFTNWWQGTLNECTSTEFTIEAEGEYLVFVTTSSLPPLQQSTR